MSDNQPEKMYHISMTQLSVARHYGGCTYNGAYYVYNPKEDSLTREDVLTKELAKQKQDNLSRED